MCKKRGPGRNRSHTGQLQIQRDPLLFNTIYETEFIYVYSSDVYSGEIKECDEGELEWVNKEDVTSLPIWEGDRIFLDLLVKDSPFFTLKLEYEGDTLVSYDLRIH